MTDISRGTLTTDTVWVTRVLHRRWQEVSASGQSVRLRDLNDGHEVTVPRVELERIARRVERRDSDA